MGDDRRDGFVIERVHECGFLSSITLRRDRSGDSGWVRDANDALVFASSADAHTVNIQTFETRVMPLDEAIVREGKSLGEVNHDALSIAGPHWGDHEQQWRDRCERAAMAVVAEHERRRR